MSGHSKWATIKHKKGALDAKRGKLFSNLVKEITVAARLGGGGLESNPRLRLVVQKAREANMPSDNIDRAIKKGTGELPGVIYEEMLYEGYGPGGVALLIRTLSDNKNRTSSDVRSTLDKRGGNLASPGAVSYIFKKKGYLTVEKKMTEEDGLLDVVLNAGAEDLKSDGEYFEITTDPADYEAVRKAIEEKGIAVATGEVTMLPETAVAVRGEDAKRVLALVEALEDLDDVQDVFANFDISDEDLSG